MAERRQAKARNGNPTKNASASRRDGERRASRPSTAPDLSRDIASILGAVNPRSDEAPDTIESRRPRMPDRIAPMIASSAAEPFDSPDHIFELMWGGVRAEARVRDANVALLGRNGLDLTPSFP